MVPSGFFFVCGHGTCAANSYKNPGKPRLQAREIALQTRVISWN